MILSKRSYLFDFSSTPARVRRNTGGWRDVQARCPGSTVAAPGARHLGSVRRVSSLTDVCFWHKADIPTRLVNVRYWGVKRILPEAAEAAPVLGLFNNSN